MNLKQFRYVFTLSNEGSFSRAAEILNIKQPSLSQYIKKVENEVGMELFDRSGGYVKLTAAGRAYIDIGRRILDLEHQLEGRFSDIATYKTGSVSIGISAHRSVALMPSIVREFKKKYPGICLQIIEKCRRDLIEAADRGEFDLIITTLPVDKNVFEYETVFVEENILATTREFRAEKEDRRFPVISASMLNGLSFAMLNGGHLMQIELEDLIRTHNLSLKKEVECTSLEALLEMAKEGIGAAFIPACLAKDNRLHYYSIRETVPKREIVLMYRKGQYLSKVVLDLKDVIHTLLS